MHFDLDDRTKVLPQQAPGRSLALAAGRPALTFCLGILLINGLVVLWLLFLGRGFLPATVPLDWWNGSTVSAHNSQHLTDFYSVLHVISGAALYFLAGAVRPAWPVHRRLLVAVACSGVWEVVENTPFVIALFNDSESLNVYAGDSIINALSDTGFVALGFLAAHSFPRWLIVTGGVLAEIGMTVMIHDGFVLGTARLVLR